ncbi:MAG TPA: type IX secretion system plug protein domain-containing protein, partial [Segetibacter sp.]
QLCNADWLPANLSTFDYLKGFSQVRLSQYRVAGISQTKYVHYQAVLPDRNCVPTRSGNYLLKVFLDGDVNKLAFTRRILIYEKQAEVGLQIVQPYNTELFRTHQKILFDVNKGQINVVNPAQQIKAVVLQNFRWDNARLNVQPTFIRNNMMEFNNENELVFPAGKEFRWADLRSFRFQSDRVARVDNTPGNINVFLQPDGERTQQRYLKFTDYNGFFFIESTDVPNPWWQTDYSTVHFTFIPRGNQPYANKKVFVVGEMNKYNMDDTSAMTYNAANGQYEKTLYLKQGYYSYTYVTRDADKPNSAPLTEQTDGDYWETENDYTVLIYYRSLSGRHDELIGVSTVNSLNSRRIGF